MTLLEAIAYYEEKIDSVKRQKALAEKRGWFNIAAKKQDKIDSYEEAIAEIKFEASYR